MKTLVTFLVAFFLVTFVVAGEKTGSTDDNSKWGQHDLAKCEEGMVYHSIAVGPSGTTVAVSTRAVSQEDSLLGREKVILFTSGGRRGCDLPALDKPKRGAGVSALVFSQDGSRLYGHRSVASAVLVWDVTNGKVVDKVAEGSFGPCFALNFKANAESRAVMAFRPKLQGFVHYVEMRDAQNQPVGKPLSLHVYPGSAGGPIDLEFAPDGTFIATVAKNEVGVVDWDKAKQQWRVKNFPLSAQGYGVTVSPDNHTIAAGTVDGIFLFDRLKPNGKAVSLQGHGAFYATGKPRVDCVKFLRDGALVSGGADGTVRLWDINTKQCLEVLQYGAPIDALAVSPDGYAIYAAGTDGKIKRFYRKGMTRDTFAVATD